MSITLEQLSAKMRQGEQVPLRQTAQIVLTLEHPVHSAADRGHGHGVHRRCHGGPYRSFGHRIHRHRQLQHLAAARHAGRAVYVFFHSGGTVSGCRPAGGCPGRAAAVHAVQPVRRSGSSRFRHRHQPVSARLAGGRPGPAGGCLGLFCHLGGFPALCHGHGHLLFHAAFHW